MNKNKIINELNHNKIKLNYIKNYLIELDENIDKLNEELFKIQLEIENNNDFIKKMKIKELKIIKEIEKCEKIIKLINNNNNILNNIYNI